MTEREMIEHLEGRGYKINRPPPSNEPFWIVERTYTWQTVYSIRRSKESSHQVNYHNVKERVAYVHAKHLKWETIHEK